MGHMLQIDFINGDEARNFFQGGLTIYIYIYIYTYT